MCVSVLGSATEYILYCEPCQHLKGIDCSNGKNTAVYKSGSQISWFNFCISTLWWGVRFLSALCPPGCELFTDRDVVSITLEPSSLPGNHRVLRSI